MNLNQLNKPINYQAFLTFEIKEPGQAASDSVSPVKKVNFLRSGTYKLKPGTIGIGNDDFGNDAGR